MSTIVYNMDCMEGMKEYPDKYFDLAIVDPPYGAGLGEGGGGGGWFAPYRENAGGEHLLEQIWREVRPLLSNEQGGVGRRNSEKNHFVGCAA